MRGRSILVACVALSAAVACAKAPVAREPIRSEYVPMKEPACPGCVDFRDADHDRLADAIDRCPADAEDADGFEDDDGCPEPDDDKDQILDAIDRCPRQPEVYNGYEDEDGCPDNDKVVIICRPEPIIQRIHFVGATKTIQKESMVIVLEAAKVMKDHPELLLLEIEGHSDENGPVAKNLALSQARAEAVVDALVAAGVDRARLRAQGYGPYCPIDAGHTEAAWETNRRADFKVLLTNDGPTKVETGCASATAKGIVSAALP